MDFREESPIRTGRSVMARYAWFLDSSIRLPGGFRIGLDGIIGLIPGFGDAFAALLSGFIVLHSYREGAGAAVLIRMIGNIGADLLIGSVPIFGDVFDLAFKANQRNVRLMQEFTAEPENAQRRSAWLVIAAATALVGLLVLTVVVIWQVFGFLLTVLGAIL